MTEMADARESRARVLEAIGTSVEPLSVEQLSERTGLHPNTLRGHLGVLLAAGQVTRESADAKGRGRPRWLYRTASPQATPFQFLAEALIEQLADTDAGDLASSAAERWARVLPSLPKAHSPDEAVEEATDALNRLGFKAMASPLGDSISVTSCPYGELVTENPVICDIHTALVIRLLEQTGQEVSLDAMDVIAPRGICVARLRRPDVEPTRRITADDGDSRPRHRRTDA